MAEEYPVVDLDSDALDAARLLAERRLPGLVVTDRTGCPQSVLPASEVVQFLVPSYVRDDPSLAGVLDESMADRIAGKLSGTTVRSLLPAEPTELPRVDADDTVIEVAAVMARLRCPLVAVMEGRTLLGVVSASRLLELALAQR
jgi:CBS domain-containing protein